MGNGSTAIAGHAFRTSLKTKLPMGCETPMAHGNKPVQEGDETMNNNEYYEMIDQNYEWDCDPADPIVQALIEAIAAQKAKQQQWKEWKGPSWNDGNQVRPLLD